MIKIALMLLAGFQFTVTVQTPQPSFTVSVQEKTRVVQTSEGTTTKTRTKTRTTNPKYEVVVCSAVWCGPCQSFKKSGKIERIKERYRVAEIDIDQRKDWAAVLPNGIPAVWLIRSSDRIPVQKWTGHVDVTSIDAAVDTAESAHAPIQSASQCNCSSACACGCQSGGVCKCRTAEMTVPAPVQKQEYISRYYNYNGSQIDLETYGRCSMRNCGMCAEIMSAKARYFASKNASTYQTMSIPVSQPKPDIGPQASSPSDVVDEAIDVMQLTVDDVVAELGCGDAGVAIRLVQESGCRVEGYEIDPVKVAEARRNVAAAGLTDRITIHEADVIGLKLPSDISAVYAYLYEDLLEQIKPQLMTGRIAVCPGHFVDGVGMKQSGQLWVRS